ncbi:MAG: hypothetical protein H0U44_11895 [Flavisolibacter sp.]|jgi:Fe2+ transport system protein B|nr:hypothetical protein [Flavisolibacter sp.]
MKKALRERNIVVILFIMVLIVFSMAQRDSKKLDELYRNTAESIQQKLQEQHFARLQSRGITSPKY